MDHKKIKIGKVSLDVFYKITPGEESTGTPSTLDIMQVHYEDFNVLNLIDELDKLSLIESKLVEG